MVDLGYVTIPTEEFERLHSEINRHREQVQIGHAAYKELEQHALALRAENERLKDAKSKGAYEVGYQAACTDWQSERDALRAENELLRANHDKFTCPQMECPVRADLGMDARHHV